MQYRVLGRTGLRLPALSFGASSLGGVFRKVEEAECIRTVQACLENKINFIDTSPFYGLTQSEIMLGKALTAFPRESYILATKAGRYGQSAADFDFSAARITSSIDESLKRLGTDYVDLLYAHDIEFGDLNQIICETIPALRRIQKAGKARFVGVTGLPIKVLKTVAEAVPMDVVLSYCHFTLLDDSLSNLIPMLKSRGIGIVNASPLGMGLLSQRGAPQWHPASSKLKETCDRAAAHCAARGSSIEKLAIQYSLTNSEIATTLVGTADPEEMRANIHWAGEAIDPQLLGEVMDILKPVHNLTWNSGREENN